MYSLLGSWALVNTTVLLVSGWNYLPGDYMPSLFAWLALPIGLWLVSADLINAHRHKIISDIEGVETAASGARRAGLRLAADGGAGASA